MMDDYYSIVTAEHHTDMFASLHLLQKQGVLCDVILAAEDGEVMAHKVLLMAASSYFRERLSPTPSATASRVYLRGISVVELANLVKYIYTGKLLVAKETMDVTLEVSEILELNGVIKGYSEIIDLERKKAFDGKAGSSELDHYSGQLNNIEDAHMSMSNDGVSTTEQNSSIISSALSPVDQAVPQTTGEIKEICYSEDNSTVTYTIEQPVSMDTQTHNTATADYNFEFSQFDKQYMEVSADNRECNVVIPSGSIIQQPEANTASSNKLQHVVTEDIVIDEQAQHQDLLSVAIEKLSDGSHAFESDSNVAHKLGHQPLQKSPSKKPDKYVNGKIDTKIVTLSAGKVSNDLGGHTSVYTVALDPSTIKQPLKMPRFQRRKTEKERLAEQNAKRYRQKKAELIAGKSQPEFQNSAEKGLQIVRNDYGTLLEVKDCLTHLDIQTVEKDPNVADSLVHTQYSPNFQAVISIPIIEGMQVNDQGENVVHIQHVETVLEPGEESVTHSDSMSKTEELSEHKPGQENVKDDNSMSKTEDFSCEVNFDCEDDVVQTVSENDHVKIVQLGNIDVPKVVENDHLKMAEIGDSAFAKDINISESKNIHMVCSKDNKSSKLESGDSLTGSSQLDQSKTDTDENLYATEEDGLEQQNEKSDSLVTATTRSSVNKRKGKVPMRLSNMLRQKAAGRPELCPKNVPLVRTRRSSRNEGSDVKKKPAIRSPGACSAGKIKVGKSDSDEIQELEKDGYTLMDDSKEEHKEAAEEDVEYDQDYNRIESILLRKAQDNIAARDIQALEENTEAVQREAGRPSVANCDERERRILNKDLNDCSDLKMETKGIKRKRNDNTDSSTDLSSKNVKTLPTERCNKLSDSSKAFSSVVKLCQEESKVSSQPMLTRNKLKRKPEISETGKDCRLKGFPDVVRDETMNEDNSYNAAFICPENNSRFTSKTVDPVRSLDTQFHDKTGSSSKLKETHMVPAESVIKQEPADIDDNGFVCKCCKSEFRAKVAMKGHLKSRLMFGNCKCIHCGETFKKGSDFFNHLMQQHGIAAYEDLNHFKCKECSYIGFSTKQMNIHYRNHEDKVVKCTKCPQTFETKKEMRTHLNTHRVQQSCPDCDFTTHSKGSLNVHVKLKHSTEKEVHKCQFCPYKTPLIGNLRKHMQTAHELTVVTKQSNFNRVKFKDFEEGVLLTKDGEVFDPSTTPIPKLSNRLHRQNIETGDDMDDTDSSNGNTRKRSKTRKVALMNLSPEEFTKEILKRHEEYLKKPEKVHRVMSKSLAVATAHPSFPQASPSVRVNKANKLYHTPKQSHSFPEFSGREAQHYLSVETVDSSLPSVEQEVEIQGHNPPSDIANNSRNIPEGMIAGDVGGNSNNRSDSVIMSLPETVDGKLLQVVIDEDGQRSIVDTMNVVSVLLEAGHHIQVQEEVEIQNE